MAFERLGSFMSREEVRIQSFLINTVVFQVLSQETGSMPDRPPIWVYLKRVNYGSVDPLLKSNFLLDMIFFFQEIMSLLVLKREENAASERRRSQVFYNCLSAQNCVELLALKSSCTYISTPSFTNVDMVILVLQRNCLCPSILKIRKNFRDFLKSQKSEKKCIPQCLKISLAWTLSWFPTI